MDAMTEEVTALRCSPRSATRAADAIGQPRRVPRGWFDARPVSPNERSDGEGVALAG